MRSELPFPEGRVTPRSVSNRDNPGIGEKFERLVKEVLARRGLVLQLKYRIPIGISQKKDHAFDLGSGRPRVIVECKAHTWQTGSTPPAAKLANWRAEMGNFRAAPSNYRKILAVLKSTNDRTGETLLAYFLRTNGHLVPDDLELLEVDWQGCVSEYP